MLEAAGGAPAEFRRDLLVVLQNARTLLKHVNDLLDVAKLDARQMELGYSRVDLARLVKFSAGHFEVLARDRHLRFAVDVEQQSAPDAWLVEVDEEKILRVLLNVLRCETGPML